MVKYADGPTTSVEVELEAPVAEVWPLLVDINVPARFSEEFQGAEWLDAPIDGGDPALGATFRGYNRHPVVGEWNIVCTVTDIEPGQIFEWSAGVGDARAARWRFELQPTPAGGSTLRFVAEMGPGPSGLTPIIQRKPDREEDIVANRLAEWTANMQRTIDGIKGLADGSE